MGDQSSVRDVDRRALLKRAGLVAGATMWATPTIQSLGSAAFATGTGAPCNTFIGFKFEVDGKAFTTPSDNNNGDCQPDVCDDPDFTIPAGRGPKQCWGGFCVTVTATRDERASITITAPEGGSIQSVDVKAKTGGGSAGPDTCLDPGPTSVVGPTFVRLDFTKPGRGRGLSNFAGCFCVVLPPV